MIIVGLIDLNCRSLSHQKGHWIWFIEGNVWLLWLLWMNSIPRSRPQNHGWRLSWKGHCIISHLSFKEALGFSWDLHVGKGLGKGWEKVEGCWFPNHFPTISQGFWGGIAPFSNVYRHLWAWTDSDSSWWSLEVWGSRYGFWVFPIHTIFKHQWFIDG